MKNNPLLIAILTMCVCFLSCRSSQETSSVDPEKERVVRFWQYYKQATDFRIKKRFPEAIHAYSEALKLNPQHEESLYYLGNCYYETGRHSDAIHAYERILKFNGQSNRALSQMGILLSTPEPGAMMDPDRAEVMFGRARAINPEESGPYIRSGLLAAQQKDWDDAYQEFMTAAGFRSPEAMFLAGTVQFLSGRHAEAQDLFTRVLEINATERKISGRGVSSEGDVRSDTEGALNLMEKAGVKSLLWLNWSAAAQGKFPSGVPEEHRIQEQKGAFRWTTSPLKGRIAWGDWDGDGDEDPATVWDGRVTVFRNDHGRLSPVNSVSGIAGTPFSLIWIDFDMDGRMDLYAFSPGYYGTGHNRMYRNEGNAKFNDVTDHVGLFGERSTADAVAIDVDLDGDPDLIECGNGSGSDVSLRLYRNDNGVFRQATQDEFPSPTGMIVKVVAGDYNQDHLPDLVATVWKDSPVLFENLGGGKFADRTASAGLNKIQGQSYGALFWNFDGDNYPDLLFTQWAPYAISLLRFVRPEAAVKEGMPRLFVNHAGNFHETTRDAGLTHAYGTMSVAAADLDGDSWTDFVLGNGSLDTLRSEPSVVFYNKEGKQLKEEPIPSSLQPLNTQHVSIHDADGDGTPEIYLSTGLAGRKNRSH